MNQPQLINTHLMSSSKTIARLARERATLRIGKTHRAPDANTVLGAAATSITRPLSSQPKIDTAEFNLPDEDRYWTLWHLKCPTCGCHQIMGRDKAKGYCVKCSWNLCNRHLEILYHPTSQQAIVHWKMVAALTKG